MYLTTKQELLIIWWWISDIDRHAVYKSGIDMGMAAKYAFERAEKYGR